MRLVCQFLYIFATLVHHSAALCGSNGEYLWDSSTKTSVPTNTTEFQKNLDDVLFFLPTNETMIRSFSWAGLYQGIDPNAAYAQARCIGHVDYQTCQECIQNATNVLINDCSSKHNSALIRYGDYCIVQYSNHDMYDTVQMRDDLVLIKNDTPNVEPSSITDAFNGARTKLFNALALRAKGRPDGYQMFAAGKWYDGSINVTIYGFAQCSSEINSDHCGGCLAIVSQKLGEYFDGKIGGSIVGPSCNFQYDINSFINDISLVIDNLSPPLPPPPPKPPQSIASASSLLPPTPFMQVNQPSTGKGAKKALLVICILVPPVIISIVIFFGIYLFTRKNHKKPTTEVEILGIISDDDESIFEPGIKTEETLQYDFPTISAATENFSEANKLGQGGFGAVYKGNLQNGDQIAVKRLSQTSGQGEVEFKNEVTLLAKLQHRNLVKLLGFCLKKKERLLIYEFVANSSLDNFIFDPIKRTQLNWDRLYKIIAGVARGLLYLHEDSRLRIIHRDLKSSNILLDNEMTPKIADFGIARLFVNDETHGNTSKIVGTYGYMAPEYAMHGQFSFKSDVFSFGVLLMEIISGRRNTFFCIETSVEDLLSYAWKHWQEGTNTYLLDPALRFETSSAHEITRCIHIGLLCAQEDVTQRPNMASVVNLLCNLSIPLPAPSKPASFQQRSNNQVTPLLEDFDLSSGVTGNSSGSKTKFSMACSTDTEMLKYWLELF